MTTINEALEYWENQPEDLTEYIQPEEEIIDYMEPESIYDSFQTIKELCNKVLNPYD
jgi:hypothetical protein